jgi:hypothetical protein
MMKTVPSKRRPAEWLTAMMTVAFIIAGPLSYAAGHASSNPASLVVTKSLNSRKHKVRLFTAADAKTILFTVDGANEKHYTLFVFDLEGKLVTQAAVGNHEISILPDIRSGGYLYEVLVDDQPVERGQLTVK